MVTMSKDAVFVANQNGANTLVGDVEFRGLSTDTKPTDNVINGSSFIEIDTGKIYFFDAIGVQWLEWGAE